MPLNACLLRMLLVAIAAACPCLAVAQTTPSLGLVGSTGEVRTELTIRAGDVLAFAYVFESPVSEDQPYRIQVEDTLSLFFPYNPVVLSTGDYIVPPDGMVAFKGLEGQVKVLGLSAQELTDQLVKLYAPVFSEPKVNLLVRPADAQNTALRRLFMAQVSTNEERMQSFMTQAVPPDRLLGLPLLERVPTAGRSVAQLGRELTERYRALGYTGLTVSVWYHALDARTVSVLGEVRNPGVVSVGAGLRLWDALATAGGPTRALNQVRASVIDVESTPTRRSYSLSEFLESGDTAFNPLLRGGELISVGGQP